MSGRDANQLAAAIKDRSATLADWAEDAGVNSSAVDDERAEIVAALDELVALVGTLQQTVRQHRSYADRREGMVIAYDDTGLYVGCIGAETWRWLLERPEMDALALGTLQQERDEYMRGNLWVREAAKERERAEAAEAALAETEAARENWKGLAEDRGAALTNMTGWHNEAQARVNELEAALATTRQALTWIAQTSPDRTAARAARRALADTGGDTKEPA